MLLKLLKRTTEAEAAIGILSFIIGIFLVINSGYLIYAYHFGGILFNFMLPMTTLVPEFLIGILLIISFILLIINIGKASFLYKLSGIIIMLYSINLNILELIYPFWGSYSFYYFIILPIGLFFFLYFNQERYRRSLISNKLLFLIGFLSFLLIDIIFDNWMYF